MNIIEMKRLQTENERKCAEMETEIFALNDSAKDLEEWAEKAAEAGNIDRYMDLKQRAERTKAEAYVKTTMLKKMSQGFTMEDIQAAWRAYMADYDKQYSKKLDKYNKALQDLRGLFDDLLAAQRDALAWREYACKMAGISRQSAIVDEDIADVFPMPFLPVVNARTNEATAAAFFYGGIDEKARNEANVLLRYHLLQPLN